MDKRDFFIGELRRLPADRKLSVGGSAAKIRCPNPEHAGGNERTQSLKITLTGKYSGAYNCFGCKIHGGWNKLARMLRLRTLNREDQQDEFSINRLIKDETKSYLPNFDDMIPWSPTVEWRSISAKTMLKFNAKVEDHPVYGVVAVFPVTLFGEPVGLIRARVEAQEKSEEFTSNYFNLKGEWAAESLFGYDLAVERIKRYKGQGKPIVLWIVEGPRDCANVYQHGGIAVALIGAAVTPAKLRLITLLDPDIIIIATDPDDAGRRARNYIIRGKKDEDGRRVFEGIGHLFPRICINFREDRDPAKLTKNEVRKFHKAAREKLCKAN